ncbi:hypothetical protein PYW08_014545 [Mythimna loreyi]|uniref:Uncharacterized protein n=1 Tax=Mythimna loreyi TaxID=667449 RepID=A0ACC2R288_9NEOP|nr:hypothetical protein PYW08_014545 [Mythimna loreyi]
MCRFVVLAVIVASLVSCVPAETESPAAKITTTPNPTNSPSTNSPTRKTCNYTDNPAVKNRRKELMICFKSIVEHRFNRTATLQNSKCTNVTVLVQKLTDYFDDVYKNCGINGTLDYTKFAKLVEFSLGNDLFKTFYKNIDCIKGLESHISNTCVKGKLGYYNITKPENHISWFLKGKLVYDNNTCKNSKKVVDCVAKDLHQCSNTTSAYVMSLFEYARELGNCSQYKETEPIPSPEGNGSTDTWLTTPVIIVLSIGGAVVVGAIITIIVIKTKK